ncbi:hypothetical protein Hanom_Chr04g00351501 [Helianthus anomalus]
MAFFVQKIFIYIYVCVHSLFQFKLNSKQNQVQIIIFKLFLELEFWSVFN